MKKLKIVIGCMVMIIALVIFLSFLSPVKKEEQLLIPDISQIPHDKFGDAVKYGRELMINTALYIGPQGTNGKYLGNKMNCTNCHQDAGTKAFSFSLMQSHEVYPQYRAREGKVLTLADRINNCIERPHNGKPLPLDSKEMIAFLSYFKWINGFTSKTEKIKGVKNLEISFPPRAASSEKGRQLFALHCQSCHGANGEGQLRADNITYAYPPLWGETAYQRGSSMHRVIKMAQWLKANMPFGKATWDKPFLSDEEALDIAAFVNDDVIHKRPYIKTTAYPYPEEKAIDYDEGPFVDTFSAAHHKFGPYTPIINYWKNKGMKPMY
ncbi:MAG: c-type cytochrome [Bacteroidota bacterium]|nr:c-type cytochrome [Bacteroidota bacterium]